jgi:hypothetical protein
MVDEALSAICFSTKSIEPIPEPIPEPMPKVESVK